jgi:hypothetical protein
MGELIQGANMASVINGMRKMARAGCWLERCEVAEIAQSRGFNRIVMSIELRVVPGFKAKKGGGK